LKSSHVWGLDLSGTAQGAGGVGGLLLSATSSAVHAAAYDGNGNVLALYDAVSGAIAAEYEYGPFGEVLKSDGMTVEANPFGFSTKYRDAETGLNYYGFRYYNPSTGRWLSRDPIEERGGGNLYGFVANLPTGAIDPLGLKIVISQNITPLPGSRVTNQNFASRVMSGFRQVVGNSGTIGVEPIKDANGNITGWEVVIRSENPNGRCNDCWQLLKEVIEAAHTVNIQYNLLMVDNASADSSGDVRDVNISPNYIMPLPTALPGGGYSNMQAPFAPLLFHEAIGHAGLGLGHPNEDWNHAGSGSPKIDPTIAIENMARACLRRNGFSDLNYGDRHPHYYHQ
jgi:RHS repeat-associated protein